MKKGSIVFPKILSDYIEEYGEKSLVPGVYARLGKIMTNNGETEAAKVLYMLGAGLGLTSKSNYYATQEAKNLGFCLTVLLTQYSLNEFAGDVVFKATALAYLYLSNSINQQSNSVQHSLAMRAVLFEEHKQQSIVQMLIQELGVGQLVEPYIISDCFRAASAEGPIYDDLILKAKSLHQELDSITIAGKDADEYTLADISKIGEERHFLLYNILEPRYLHGDYDTSEEELSSIFSDEGQKNKNPFGDIDPSEIPF